MRVDTPKRDGGDLAVFDLARASAALAVLVAHGRSLLLLDLKNQPNLSAAGRLFYGATGLGHQAVIVFFVASGALVTRAMLRLEAGGAWSARSFIVARLSRLWTVLLPCLILGGVLDRLGTALGDGLVYAGRYGALRPWAPPEPIRLDLMTLAGNLGFLQTIAVPTFGTNVPLWSLANEAWYYLAAFLLWSAWRKRAQPVRAGLWAGGALLLWLVVLTPDMRWLAPTWAIGAALTVFGSGAPPSGWRLALAPPHDTVPTGRRRRCTGNGGSSPACRRLLCGWRDDIVALGLAGVAAAGLGRPATGAPRRAALLLALLVPLSPARAPGCGSPAQPASALRPCRPRRPSRLMWRRTRLRGPYLVEHRTPYRRRPGLGRPTFGA